MRLAANIVAIPLLVIVHIGALALVARLLGSKVYEVSFGFGPVLKRYVLNRTSLTLRAIPTGGFVRMQPPVGLAPAGPEPDGAAFSDLSRVARAAVYSAGCLATFAVAVLLLGASEAGASFARGFGQFIGGALSPLDQGVRNLRTAIDLLRSASFATSVGVVASKMAAFNLIPVPSLNGFDILRSLLLGTRQSGWLIWAVNGGAVLVFLAFASYGLAALAILWHP